MTDCGEQEDKTVTTSGKAAEVTTASSGGWQQFKRLPSDAKG